MEYKKVAARIPGLPVDSELILKRLLRLNKDLVTQGAPRRRRRVRLVVTIDTPSLEVLRKLDWKAAIGMGLADFTLFSSRTRVEAAQDAASKEHEEERNDGSWTRRSTLQITGPPAGAWFAR